MTRASDTARLLSGGAVINEDSNDVDFRVESNGNTHALFVDGGNDGVGIGTSSVDTNATMTISNTGDNHALSIVGALNKSRMHFQGANTGSASTDGLVIGLSSSDDTNDDSALIALKESGSMTFQTGGSNRARINDKGLLINTTSTLHSGVERALEVENHSGSGFVAIFKGNNKDHETVAIHNSDTSGTRILLAFKTSGSTGTLVGRVTSDGSTTTYATSSDYRLKENVSYDFDATTRLKQLKPARFNWIADESNTTVDGFIAHEVSSVVPEAVIGEKDAVDADGNIDPQGIDQSKLVPLLVKSLQEAIAEIDTLKTKVAALESK